MARNVQGTTRRAKDRPSEGTSEKNASGGSRHGLARSQGRTGERKTRSRSFRFTEELLSLLDERAQEGGESTNSLAEQLIYEGLRTRSHPLIYFRQAGGDRRPALVGTRLYVWQVIETVRASDGSIEDAAEYLSLGHAQVQACVSYYADFQDEVEAYAEEEREFARRHEDRWRREQQVLG